MKKVKSTLIIITIFLITYFLQINFFSWFTIRGIKPNLFIILALFMGLYTNKKISGILGLAFGIILDILIGKSIGFTGILLAMICLLGGYFDKNFSKDSRLTIILMTLGATILFEVAMYVINIVKFKLEVEIAEFALILATEVLYNIVLVIILYPGIKKLGYYIEDISKEKKLLTRYF